MSTIEPHEFVPPAPGTRDAEFGWCAREDCGSAADSYAHASEEERRKFDGRQDRSAGQPPMNASDIRYHSSDDMDGLGELAGTTEPVAVVLRKDGSVDAYGYIGVVDQRPELATLSDVLEHFTADEIRCLVHTAAEMAGAGASHHDLSSRQITLSERAWRLFNGME